MHGMLVETSFAVREDLAWEATLRVCSTRSLQTATETVTTKTLVVQTRAVGKNKKHAKQLAAAETLETLASRGASMLLTKLVPTLEKLASQRREAPKPVWEYASSSFVATVEIEGEFACLKMNGEVVVRVRMDPNAPEPGVAAASRILDEWEPPQINRT